MSDYSELKRLAKAATIGDKPASTPIKELIGAQDAFRSECRPEKVLALIAENESARKHWQSESNNVQVLMAEVLRLKAENAGLRTGYQAYEQVNAELKAENEALRKALMDAEYRIDQGKVWTENGWMYAGLSQQGQMKALEILREATKLKLNNHSYIHQYRGPKITKPTPPNKPSEPIVRRVVNEKVINANEVKP